MKRKYWIFFSALVLVAVFVGLMAKRVYVEEAKRKRNDAGYSTFALTPNPRQGAPNFELKDLDGRMVGLQSMRGKVVLINFRTTW